MKSTQMADKWENQHYKRWFWQAPLGLILVGMGLCFVAEAAYLKFGEAPTLTWVLAGTGALIVFNAGLCVFGDAILHRVRYENQKPVN